MFVTSDIFDLRTIGRFRGLDWRENLLGGVDLQGSKWPGYQAAARFMIEASKRCGLLQEMDTAGYDCPNERRTRPISPKSFERLIEGKLSGAKDASAVLLRGQREAVGTHANSIMMGDEAGSHRTRRGLNGPTPVAGPPWRFSVDFIFPLVADSTKVATDLFELSVDILGAEYGYYFVRDGLCGPWLYTHGVVAPLDYKALSDDDAEEVGGWADFVGDGRLWSSDWPLFRDLFQMNLLSERHTAKPVKGLGRLTDWIQAQPERGRLESIGQGRWRWTLTDAEMVAVRPILNEAGLLLSCRDRVYRDLPGGGRTPSRKGTRFQAPLIVSRIKSHKRRMFVERCFRTPQAWRFGIA